MINQVNLAPSWHVFLTLKTLKYLCINYKDQTGFSQFEIIINVLVRSSRFLSIHMLWLYRHFKLLILSVRGPFSDVRICLSICLISVHITLCILLRRWFSIDPALCQCIVCRGVGEGWGWGCQYMIWLDKQHVDRVGKYKRCGLSCRVKKQNAHTQFFQRSLHCIQVLLHTPPPQINNRYRLNFWLPVFK